MAGIWKVTGTTKLSIEINMPNNRGTQENEQYRRVTIFMNSALCSLSNLLLLLAKFLELVGSSVCIRQALASVSTYCCQEINPTCCKEKKDKEASCSIDIVWGVLHPQWRAKTLPSVCFCYQLGNACSGIIRWRKSLLCNHILSGHTVRKPLETCCPIN